MSRNISDRGHEIDGISLNNNSWLSLKNFLGESVDVVSAHRVNLFSILVESQLAIRSVVLGNFFESILLVLEILQHVQLQLGLHYVELIVANGLLEASELVDQESHKISRVRASSSDFSSKESAVSKNVTNSIDGVYVWLRSQCCDLGGNELLHHLKSSSMFTLLPGRSLECELDRGLRRLSPVSELSTNVL